MLLWFIIKKKKNLFRREPIGNNQTMDGSRLGSDEHFEKPCFFGSYQNSAFIKTVPVLPYTIPEHIGSPTRLGKRSDGYCENCGKLRTRSSSESGGYESINVFVFFEIT